MFYLYVTAPGMPARKLALDRPVTTIGRSSMNDLPIADKMLSRQHARIVRDSDGALTVEDCGSRNGTFVNGDRLASVQALKPGDRITLANACQLQFVQPSPVSTSARLDLVSKHRLPLAVDAVLLMADSLLLGPGAQVHVTMPDLKQPLVLYRHKDRLGVRYAGPLTIDGQRSTERGLLGPNSSVVADEFAFAIEPVGTRMGRL